MMMVGSKRKLTKNHTLDIYLFLHLSIHQSNLPSVVLRRLLSCLDSSTWRCRMYRYEQRDRSGPMDVDGHDPVDRLALFALHDPEEGPSRKRELYVLQPQAVSCAIRLQGKAQVDAVHRTTQRDPDSLPPIQPKFHLLLPDTALRTRYAIHVSPPNLPSTGIHCSVQALRPEQMGKRDVWLPSSCSRCCGEGARRYRDAECG